MRRLIPVTPIITLLDSIPPTLKYWPMAGLGVMPMPRPMCQRLATTMFVLQRIRTRCIQAKTTV